MKTIINSQITLSRPLEGPLAPYIALFAAWSGVQGYSSYSLYRQVLLASDFSRWLRQKGVTAQDVCSAHREQYLRHRARRVRIARGDAAGLQHFMVFLRREGVNATDEAPPETPTPVEQCVRKFEYYLREERALAPSTVVNYVPFIRDFLTQQFADRRVRLGDLCASDVVGFVQRRAPQLHIKRAKLMTSALRSFLKYARYRGEVALDLAAAVPAVACWSMPSIPRAIAADQVRQLLASIDRRTAMGRRDYAILLLLARLGLRSSEVAFVELDDFDWNTGTLSVRGKSGQRNEFPLPLEVGKAIAAYLRNGRPLSTSRRVFLRAKAPIRGFRGASGVGSVVRHALQRARIDAPTYGAHQFRHGLATEMLRQGASLGEIGDVLGHRHPQTTKIYTKVDLEALRTLALPWPGGVQ